MCLPPTMTTALSRLIPIAAVALALATAPDAHALSEIQRRDLPPVEAEGSQPASPEDEQGEPDLPGSEVQPPIGQPVPLPDPPSSPPPAEAAPAEDEPGEEIDAEPAPSNGDEAAEPAAPQEPLPDVLYDLSLLPEPVRRTHGLLVEACRSGDIERLRPLIETGERGTQLSFGAVEGDPIEFLRQMSGDSKGHEILAILLEVLNAGFVNLDPGTPNELYVWPYFFAVPLDRLDARQRVELFTIVTAGDYEDMKTYGAYIFYRVGITPEGRWAFFVAGD